MVSGSPVDSRDVRPRLQRAVASVSRVATGLAAAIGVGASIHARLIGQPSLAPPALGAAWGLIAISAWCSSAHRRSAAVVMAWFGLLTALWAAATGAATPVATILLALAGTAVLVRERDVNDPPAEWLGHVAVLLIALGTASLTADATGVPMDLGRGGSVGGGPGPALVTVLVGAAIAGQAWLDAGRARPGGPRWLAPLAGSTAAAIAVPIWWALSVREAGLAAATTALPSQLPAAVLGMGLVLAALLATVVALGQRARTHSGESQLTSRQQLEASRELERSNRELTEFAAVASHDLRAPLRSVSSFVGLIEADYGATFTDEGRTYVVRIKEAVQRMTSLIDGLLALSGVRAKGELFVPVRLGDVAHEVVADLAGGLDESGGVVEIGPLPEVEADRLQMRQLLQNLIGNALEFRRPGVAPHVVVSATPTARGDGDDVMWELRVADNGIGLDPADADRIFEPFERLHARASFEGSGLGLAVCARIVERHGGRIRVEGRPAGGTTVIVTIPAAHRRREAA